MLGGVPRQSLLGQRLQISLLSRPRRFDLLLITLSVLRERVQRTGQPPKGLMATLVSKFRSTAGFKCPEEKGMPRERTESPYEAWNNQLGVPISLAILALPCSQGYLRGKRPVLLHRARVRCPRCASGRAAALDVKVRLTCVLILRGNGSRPASRRLPGSAYCTPDSSNIVD